MSTDVFDIADPLPSGTTLLEASAGTGKTWTIGALVTRYVAEGVARLDELLVVTFGRAATQELRERVREQLIAAERALADPAAADPQDALLTLLTTGEAQELADRRRRVRQALADFDAATIATTHQFCHLVLRSLGVAGDTDAEAVLVEDLDDRLVEVVDDLYLRGFRETRSTPFFDRSTALAIARAAARDNPQATLGPHGAPRDGEIGRRVGFAEAVRAELDRRKRGLGVLSYDDLLSQLADALEEADAPARQRMRQRWRVVLVDEFQDTDPVQWQVLQRAFDGHSTLVLIGDPKQAIYAFRGGDVFAYLDAARAAGRRRTLGQNWRSDAPLVEALSGVLGGVQLGGEEIVVHPIEARRRGSRLQGAPHPAPWRLRVLSRANVGEAGDESVAKVGQTRPVIVADAAADIAELLDSEARFDGRRVQAGDVAVLAEVNAHLHLMQEALGRRGIRSVLAGSGSVLATDAGQAWLTVLEAMAAPHRSGLVRAAGLTPLIGRDAAALDAHAEAETEALASLLRRWAELFALRGVAAVLEAAVANGLAERILSATGGERRLTDLRHVAEVLHAAAQREGMGLMSLLAWLRTQRDDDAAGAGSRTRRLDSDAHAVQLVTVHASKGLQYPVVYLPFAGDRNVREDSLPLFHGGESGLQRCLDVGGAPTDAVRAAASSEDADESLRKFYVALTRAQSQVVTWWAPVTTAKHSALHRVLVGRGPGQGVVPEAAAVFGDDQVRVRFAEWSRLGGPSVEEVGHAPVRAAPPEPERPDLAVRSFTRTVDTDWRRTSYTALSAAAEQAGPGVDSEPETPGTQDEPPAADALPVGAGPSALSEQEEAAAAVASPMAGLPVGATFGSLVHAVLELADLQADDLEAELAAQVREQVVRWPVPGLDQADLTRSLVRVCTTGLGDLAGDAALVDIPDTDRLCELDFELPLTGGDLLDARATPRTTLGQIAPLLRRHLPAGDPVLGYADALDQPELGDQPLRGYLTGSVDVMLRVGGRYLVVDYKTNWLGEPDVPLTAADYTPRRLDAAMGHSSYPLQALLYAVVAHRFLRWRLRGYDPHTHLGGVLYLYLRGMCGPDTPRVEGAPTGVFAWRPPVALVEELSDLLDGRATP